jgi:methyltransferase-like protein
VILGTAYQKPPAPATDSGELYDRVPYEGGAVPGSHPDSLAVVASLVGFSPVRLDRCRVLEVGCGFGNNLLPMAAGFPGSQFIGIDASAVQIKAGRDFLATTGLTNVELRHMSIMDTSPSMGAFDYIICHGVWNVVPSDVQDKILELTRDLLSANGLAYVGYNTLPGWGWKGALRNMLRLHASYHEQFGAQVHAARKFLAILADNIPGAGPYAAFVREENRHIASQSDAYVFHEYLAERNEPIYFMQFAERAEKAGLKFVADANLAGSMIEMLPKPLGEVLLELPADRIEHEQHVDFLHNRSFRQTVLCRADHELRGRIDVEAIPSLSVVCAAKPENPAADLQSVGPEKFVSLSAGSAVVTDPFQKTALAHLGANFPRAIPFSELVRVVSQQSTPRNLPVTPENARALASILLQGYLHRFVGLHLRVPDVVSRVTPKPIAWPMSRAEALKGDIVTNTRHAQIRLPVFSRCLITLLDGTRDREALTAALLARIENGEFTITANDPAIKINRENQKQLIGTHADWVLNDFCRSAFLVG